MHRSVLMAMDSLRFPVGRRMMIDVLKGNLTSKIIKHKLDRQLSFGVMALSQEHEIEALLDELVINDYASYAPLQGYKFLKVYNITDKGKKALSSKNLKFSVKEFEYAKVTDDDRRLFASLGDTLKGLSDEQKKAVVDQNNHILCIAGAGSGKTRVLTKRFWFLNAIKGIPKENLLAITFTRKARKEMQSRLDVKQNIETFNSFCEKILQNNQLECYGRVCEVLSFSKKIRLMNKILKELGTNPGRVIMNYYGSRKYNSEDPHTLYLGFINDLFSALDYQRNNDFSYEEFYKLVRSYKTGLEIEKILKKIEFYKNEIGLRDYTDQLVHAIDFFRQNPDKIPKFEHILVDEFQDVNELQIKLLEILNPANLFVVGDPRQSIFGWRGSKIKYILNFKENYPDAQVLSLKKNYRSDRMIVELCNSVISTMRLPDLESESGRGSVRMIKHDNEESEAVFVANSILSQENKDIFVLARTNRQLEKMAKYLDQYGVRYLKRTVEESNLHKDPEAGQITLSTVHAIKGLEAETVYIIGANNFPCRANDHPLLESVKVNDDYDKYQEELRLLYVALSRAKKSLIINYHRKLSSLFSNRVLEMINDKPDTLEDQLRAWRRDTAKLLNIPAYHIFSDKTLVQLCEHKPKNLNDLDMIPGFGDFKIKRYGKDIVDLISNHTA